MLTVESHTAYYVFPSWADVGVTWDDLSLAFDDPLRHAQIDINTVNWLKTTSRYAPPMPPYQLMKGSAGGGIVITDETGCEQPSALFLILSRTVGGRRPDGLPIAGAANIPRVGVLEPRGDLHLILGRRVARPHYCSTALEHVDAALGDVYWVADHSATRSPVTPIELPSELAEAFGFGVRRVEPSAAMTAETEQWYVKAKFQRTWYRVTSESTSAGLHLAVMVYVAYEMKKRLGRRLDSMCLVSHIEGQPHWRSAWR